MIFHCLNESFVSSGSLQCIFLNVVLRKCSQYALNMLIFNSGLMVCFMHAIVGHCSDPELYCVLTLVYPTRGVLTGHCQLYIHSGVLTCLLLHNMCQCLRSQISTDSRFAAVSSLHLPSKDSRSACVCLSARHCGVSLRPGRQPGVCKDCTTIARVCLLSAGKNTRQLLVKFLSKTCCRFGAARRPSCAAQLLQHK